MRLLRAGLAGCLLLALVVPAAAFAAAPATRDAAVDAYTAVLDDEGVDPGWTGSVSGCVVGTESQASLDATLDAVNAVRSFAGIGSVNFDATQNHKALAAALMMKAANDLSHTPGPSWPCYSDDGADAAGQSNLALGYPSGAASVVGYLADDDVPSLGHRRWVIDPGAQTFGSGSTGNTNALMVFGSPQKPVPAGTMVSWPPAGFVPWPWVFTHWSIALGGQSDFDNYATQNASVKVAVGDRQLDVTNVQTLPDFYGTGRTLSWDVDVPGSLQSSDQDLRVTIDGVKLNGADKPISYTANAIAIAGNPACDAAKAKLAKAKAKLERLRQISTNRKRIAKAKKKVKKAKAAVKAAC